MKGSWQYFMFFRNFKYLFLELKIIYIIIVAEIYNSISVRNFIRKFPVEIYLDNQCCKIAKSLKKIIKVQFIAVKANRMILASRLQKGGGLTDIYNIISKEKTVFLLTSNIFNFRSITNLKMQASKGKELDRNIGFIQRINELLNYISNPNLKDIHVLNDSCDPLIYISYMLCEKNPSYFHFYHHADHSFCFGAMDSNWNHIDLFPNQYQICKKKLNPFFISMMDFL